jgi:hypothetical protein
MSGRIKNISGDVRLYPISFLSPELMVLQLNNVKNNSAGKGAIRFIMIELFKIIASVKVFYMNSHNLPQ